MGYFDALQGKLKDIPKPIQRRYDQPGVYIFGVLETRMQSSQRFGKGDSFIAKLVTLDSNNPAQEVGAETAFVRPMSWGESSVRDIMAFIAGVAKARFEQVTIAHMNAIVDTKRDADGKEILDAAGQPILANPFFGKVVKCHVRLKQREGKEDFTEYDWYACPSDKEAAALKKFAELVKKT